MPASYRLFPQAIVSGNTAANFGPDAPAFAVLTGVLVETEGLASGVAATAGPVKGSPVLNQPLASGAATTFNLLTSGVAFTSGLPQAEWAYGSPTTSGTIFHLTGLTQQEVQPVN